jgi:tRNA(Ile)-lysidine synthase TilS/MesJ
VNRGPASDPPVLLVTAHGRQRLDFGADERLIDILRRHGVPWSGVATYVLPAGDGPPRLLSILDKRPAELEDAREIRIYFNRNVNPFLFALDPLSVVAAVPEEEAAAEYLYQDRERDAGIATTYLKKLSPEECLEIVRKLVAETVVQHVPRGTTLVIGVSGGGDSNALLDALAQLKGHDLDIRPLIIRGIPEWDLGVPRALALSERYGLELTVVDEDEVKALIGLDPASSLVGRFERAFPGDDFEFLGTLLVRLALFKRAEALETAFVCTGLNLEDVLCENMFRLSNGLKPAGVPVRTVGDKRLVFPLWLCPKRIIDGCFPRQSLDNYEERYPCLSIGRNLYYSLIYTLQSQYPGFPEQLARGLSGLATESPVEYALDEQLGIHVERFVPFPLRQRFQRMISP